MRMYDVRLKHDCLNSHECEKGIIIDLRHGDPIFANSAVGPNRPVPLNSLAINERNSNYLVLGGSDPVLRLYDRRMIGHQVESSLQPEANIDIHLLSGVCVQIPTRES